MVARGSSGGAEAGALPVDDMAPVRRRTVVAAGAVLALNVALMLAPPAIAVLALLGALR
jgi:hypothetical protein